MNINKDKIVQLADTDTIENLTSALSQRLIADQLRLTTAESCTGGKSLVKLAGQGRSFCIQYF